MQNGSATRRSSPGGTSFSKVNYRPIFHVAKRIIEAIATDDELVDRILAILCDTAKELVDQRLTQIHELAGNCVPTAYR